MFEVGTYIRLACVPDPGFGLSAILLPLPPSAGTPDTAITWACCLFWNCRLPRLTLNSLSSRLGTGDRPAAASHEARLADQPPSETFPSLLSRVPRSHLLTLGAPAPSRSLGRPTVHRWASRPLRFTFPGLSFFSGALCSPHCCHRGPWPRPACPLSLSLFSDRASNLLSVTLNS